MRESLIIRTDSRAVSRKPERAWQPIEYYHPIGDALSVVFLCGRQAALGMDIKLREEITRICLI